MSKMNYNISFLEMNRLAQKANALKPGLSLDGMRKQASIIKNNSSSKVKKQPAKPFIP